MEILWFSGLVGKELVAQRLWLLEIDFATRVQILNQAFCISYKGNTLSKIMYSAITTPAMGT